MHSQTRDPHEDPGQAERLASEFLTDLAAGRDPDRAEYLARLAGEVERRDFEGLVDVALAAERCFPRQLREGDVLAGRYRILAEIGQGGMGRVFSALDIQLGRQVAIKVLSGLVAGDAHREAMFDRESKLLAALQHPGIVAVHEASTDGEFRYIVMDLVAGRPLSEVLRRAAEDSGGEVPRSGEALRAAIGKETPEGRPDRIDESSWYRSVARITAEVARTLEAAHARGVVHRDLKPSNVHVLGGGDPILLDFGLASGEPGASAGVTQGLYGSVAYLAPEQARSEKSGSDPRSDLYQLGAILYELLTLRRAFPGEAIADVLDRVRTGTFPRPRAVNAAAPRALEAICLKAMEFSPGARYAGARELRVDLELFLEGGEPRALHASRAMRGLRRMRWLGRRHPLLAATLAAVTLASLLSSIVFLRPPLAPRISSAFRVASDGSATPVGNGDPVHPEDWLGVTLEAERPCYVYALSIFGDGRPEYMLPLEGINTLEAEEAGRDARRSGRWDLRVGEGRHHVVCTALGDEAESTEGLLVFASHRRLHEFEVWFDALALALEADELALGIRYREGLRIFEELGSSARGRPLSEVSPEVLSGRLEALDVGKLSGEATWDLDGIRRFEVHCRFETPAAGL